MENRNPLADDIHPSAEAINAIPRIEVAYSAPPTQAGAVNFGVNAKQKIRTIVIEQRDYGYIVTAGCQTFCIEKATTLIAQLSKYLHDPKKTEQDWFNEVLF